MAEDRNIHDIFNRLISRDASPEELGRFRGTSEYYIRQYVRGQPAYRQSTEFQERFASLIETFQKVFGWQPVAPDIDAMDSWIRNDVSDTQILHHWRNTDTYRNMFAGKPLWMSEDRYREIYMDKAMNQAAVQEQFLRHQGRQVSGDELNKIFFGGPGSENIRLAWEHVKRAEQGYQLAYRRGTQTTGIKATPYGPVQPLLTAPVATPAPALTQAPVRPESSPLYPYPVASDTRRIEPPKA